MSPTRGLPPLQRALEFLRRRLFGQELVGIDKAGNKYYSWREKNDAGEVVEKRRVKVPGSDILYDPHSLQPEWRAWLTRTRAAPPSEQELARSEARVAALRERVAAIEAREAARRFRATSLGREGGPDLGSFAAQLGARGFGASGSGTAADAAARPGTSSAQQQQQQQQQQQPQQRPQAAPPEPGSPLGAAESFRPGVWQPGGRKE